MTKNNILQTLYILKNTIFSNFENEDDYKKYSTNYVDLILNSMYRFQPGW